MITTTIKGNPTVHFTVRLVRKGDGYGRNNAIEHDRDEPIVEFFDCRYKHTQYGQFVSRYRLTTLRSRAAGGLLLDTGSPDWTIDAIGMQLVHAWLDHVEPRKETA